MPSAFVKTRIISVKVLVIEIVLNDAQCVTEISKSNKWEEGVDFSMPFCVI